MSFNLLILPTIFLIFVVEVFLSADNAIILATLTQKLPQEQRKKALWVGFISSFGLRFLGIFFSIHLMQYAWIQILAGLYLIYLTTRYYSHQPEKNLPKNSSTSFWSTVCKIELFDFLFAIDSIFAAIAIVGTRTIELDPAKMFYVYFGVMTGAVVIRFAANWITKAIQMFHNLENACYLLIGSIGIKLVTESALHWFYPTELFVFHAMQIIFWILALSILLYGFLPVKR